MNRRQFAKLSAIGSIGTLLFGCNAKTGFPFKKNQVIACFGDSITFGGGNGYVEMLQKLANEKRPELNLRFNNFGKSSETITGLTEAEHPGPRPYLFERLDEELNKEPVDFALFCYGINCGIYGKPSQKLFDSFKIGVYSFLEKMGQRNIRTILLTPPPLALDVNSNVDSQTTKRPYGYLNPYPKYEEEVLQEFKQIILDIEHSALLASIDIHEVLLKNQDLCYEDDPIHPNLTGHRLISETIVENLGI